MVWCLLEWLGKSCQGMVWQITCNVCTRYFYGTPILPLTPPKTSQMPTKLVSGLFMLLFLLLLPNWLSDRLPELAIGKLARSAHAKQLRQICSHSLEEKIGQDWQKRESEKCWESESENWKRPILSRRCLALAEPAASAYWMEDRQGSVKLREGGGRGHRGQGGRRHHRQHQGWVGNQDNNLSNKQEQGKPYNATTISTNVRGKVTDNIFGQRRDMKAIHDIQAIHDNTTKNNQG